MNRYYGQEDDNPIEWEEATWNFFSEYYRLKQERARRMKEEYYERLERASKNPPDEDELE